MSLFKPRWRNPDVDIALQAVDGIDNDKLLLKIVKTSKNEKVRVAALKKISSDYYPFIVDLAIKYSGLFTDISQLAVRRLIELEPLSHLDPFGNRDGLMKDRVLEVVAKKTIDLNVMQIIANQDMYLNAKKFAESKLIGIATGAVVDVPLNSDIEGRRAWAIEKINDQNILTEMLNNNPSDLIKTFLKRRLKELRISE